MSDEDAGGARRTPTDPSLEFDRFEAARLRLAGALARRDYDPLEAERIALYVVKGVRPVSQLLRVLTGARPPGDDEVMDALTRALDESPAFARAARLLSREDGDEA
jgi:hypothetical protein